MLARLLAIALLVPLPFATAHVALPAPSPDAVGSALPPLAAGALETARAFESVVTAAEAAGMSAGVALAREATRAQAAALGVALLPVATPRHPSALDAMDALAARHGVVVREEDRAEFAALDPRIDAALARVLDAHLAFEGATALAFADADVQALLRAVESGEASTALAHRAAGIDAGPVLSARLALLEAADALARELPLREKVGAEVYAPPALAIDLSGVSSEYADSFAFILDRGGNDVHYGNAGGSNALSALCFDPGTPVGGPLLVPMAAAAIDLAGDDEYAGTWGCGQNGGAGPLSAGFLYDAGGRDTYGRCDSFPVEGWTRYEYSQCRGGSIGVNGGGHLGGLGFLLDATSQAIDGASPDDAYYGTSLGVSGGGSTAGVGMLLDLDGDDLHTASCTMYDVLGRTRPDPLDGFDCYGSDFGASGGGAGAGLGTLVDTGGSDTYLARTGGSGGANLATGSLVDLDGHDLYASSCYRTAPGERLGCDGGTVGAVGGAYGGEGSLVDLAGNDLYLGREFALGAANVGAAALLDLEGDDLYAGACDYGGFAGCDRSGPFSQGYGELGTALLYDGGGSDFYVAESTCTDCGGPRGLGYRWDEGGENAPFVEPPGEPPALPEVPPPGSAPPEGAAFFESWDEGLAGWSVRGDGASVPCVGSLTGCALELAPTCCGNYVTVERAIDVPLAESTVLSFLFNPWIHATDTDTYLQGEFDAGDGFGLSFTHGTLTNAGLAFGRIGGPYETFGTWSHPSTWHEARVLLNRTTSTMRAEVRIADSGVLVASSSAHPLPDGATALAWLRMGAVQWGGAAGGTYRFDSLAIIPQAPRPTPARELDDLSIPPVEVPTVPDVPEPPLGEEIVTEELSVGNDLERATLGPARASASCASGVGATTPSVTLEGRAYARFPEITIEDPRARAAVCAIEDLASD